MIVHTTIEEKIGSFFNIVVLEYIAAGIVYLLENLVQQTILNESSSFQGFNHEWYVKVGIRISFTIFLSAFATNFNEFLRISQRMFERFKDRGYRFNLKKHSDDDFDD